MWAELSGYIMVQIRNLMNLRVVFRMDTRIEQSFFFQTSHQSRNWPQFRLRPFRFSRESLYQQQLKLYLHQQVSAILSRFSSIVHLHRDLSTMLYMYEFFSISNHVYPLESPAARGLFFFRCKKLKNPSLSLDRRVCKLTLALSYHVLPAVIHCIELHRSLSKDLYFQQRRLLLLLLLCIRGEEKRKQSSSYIHIHIALRKRQRTACIIRSIYASGP